MIKLGKLEKLLSNGKISRREFLARVSALGLAAAVSPAFLKAPAQAATPKKGGRLRLAMAGGATTDSLDPATISDNIPHCVSWQLRNNLVEINHEGNPVPELAESWESSADASQWVFKLRRGVEFHNGKTLDANDVVYSINYHRSEDSKSGAKGLLEAVQDLKTDGKDTITFTLDGGNADFPFILSDYHLTISPADTKGAEWEQGIGTGGYIFESFEPGVRAFVRRNPNYWKEGRAHFDEIETLSVVDYNSRTNALTTGQADVINKCELKTVHFLEKAPGVQVVATTGFRHLTAPMLTDMAPYDNLDARLALKYAIDREHLVKTILRGYGTVGNDHPIAPIMRYHASELSQRQYDPDKAKFHLNKAGLKDVVFDLHAADNIGGGVDAAILFKEHAAKAGININVVKETGDGYWKNIWLKKPWCMAYWGGRPTEDMMLSSGYAAESGWNDTHWKNGRFNELLVKARAELDEAKRGEMYVEMQQLVHDDGGAVIFAFADHVDAASDKIQHGPIAGNWLLDGMKCTERWWFA
jgi:peptide/nickel transport system substrate-binding protein